MSNLQKSHRRQLFTNESVHLLEYNTGGLQPTPLDVINSLHGFDKIVRRVPNVLKSATLSGPLDVEVYIKYIAAGSLKETAIVRFIWGSEKAYEDWIDAIRKKTGIEDLVEMKPIVGPIIAGSIMLGLSYGAYRMLGKIGAGKGDTIAISNVMNSVFNIGAGTLNISPEAYQAAMKEGTGNSLNLATNACRLIQPVKRLNASQPSIMVDGNLAITTEAIEAAPSKVDRSIADPELLLAENEEIVVRALDLDSGKKGWYVVVPRLTNKRIPMEIDPSVDAATITAGKPTRANIELYYTLDDEGDRKYKNAYLRKLR